MTPFGGTTTVAGTPTPTRRSTGGMSLGGKLVAFVVAFLFLGLVGSCLITIAIWPGEVKLVAPLFCTDAQPDAFVVADTYNPRPGETVTNFTLYCMGPRGDSTDHGFMYPFLAVSVLNGLVLTTLVFALGGLRRRGKRVAIPVDAPPDNRATPGTPPSGSTAGPFVH